MHNRDMFKKTNQKCFCAFCKNQRRVYRKKHIDWTNVLMSFVSSTLLMVALWQGFQPEIILFFVVLVVASEILIQVRWRMSLPCPHCGFDPLLYTRKPEEAARRVVNFIENQRETPQYWLKGDPLRQLPRRKKERIPPPPQLSKRI